MKKHIILLQLLLLTSCSIDNSSSYKSSINSNITYVKEESDDFIFEEYKNGYLISKYLKDESIVTFPSFYKNKKVIGIKNNVFEKNNNIEDIILSSNMIYFSNNCFENLNINYNFEKNNFYLKSEDNDKYLLVSYNNYEIDISSDCEVIFPFAIHESNIESLTIPSSVKYINSNSIDSCYLLEELKINSSFIFTNDNIFNNCERLKTIYIKNKIFSDDFIRNNDIIFLLNENKDYQIDNLIFNVKDIKKEDDVYYFLSNDNIGYVYKIDENSSYIMIKDSILFGNNIYDICKIYTKAFSSPYLESVILSDNIKEIDDYSFYNCVNLNNIKLPNYLNFISSNAFINCPNLTDLFIPYYTNKKNLNFNNSKLNLYYSSSYFENSNECRSKHYNVKKIFKKDKITYYINKEDNIVVGSADFDIEEVNLPNYITYDRKEYPVIKIANKAFYNCRKLKDIKLSINILTIENKAFYNCINLKYIYIPKNIKIIENEAFFYNNMLIEVEESADNCNYSNNFNSNNKVVYSVIR